MKITIMGLGYVGSAASAGLSKAGHDVLGLDVDRGRVTDYQQGQVHIIEPDLPELIQSSLANGNLRFSHIDDVSEDLGDAVVIAIGTPPSGNGAADLSQVRAALRWLKERAKPGTVVVMKSTVPPGTGVGILENELASTGICYASIPEFLREGNAMRDWFHPDRIVVGADDPRAAEVAKDIHTGIDAPYLVTDITSAELIKYASNAFLATKISFINEIASLCDIVGASIDDVSEGVAMDPRIGGASMRAGVGYGGSCFPKDVRALDYVALTNGHNFELLRSAITVNNRQRLLPLHALRERFGRLSGMKVAVLGLSFKPGTGDMREAPSVDLIQALAEDNAEISTYDPVVNTPARAGLAENVRVCSEIQEAVEGAQAVVVMTEWSEIIGADWEALSLSMESPKLLFDGRNCLDRDRMIGTGLEYQGVGRNGAHRRRSSRLVTTNQD
ncbi:MAG: UDP-glucose/GDP-mannose dehydrogenase family protein [SAR202 cluster bacterium]|nr:UDP-glucose/GDP-mannose dehydrogenase family protein [SAR202 cluster bacterium]